MEPTAVPRPEPGREERFRALFLAAHPDVLRFVARRAHPSHAEDVVAEAFTAAWRRFEEVPARPDEARAWLFGVARNCLLNTARSQGRREALAVRVAERGDVLALPDGDPDTVAERLDLAAAWRRLPEHEQEVLSLAVFEDLTSAQAARVLGTTPTAYRLRLMRARRALRRELESEPSTRLSLEPS